MGRGKRRAGPDNVRLREQLKLREADILWYRGRLLEAARKTRAWRARAEVAEGRLLAKEQQLQRQVRQLMERDTELVKLRRQLKAASDSTVEMPVVTKQQLATAAT